MNRFIVGSASALAGVAVALSITAWRYQSVIQPNTFVAGVPLGGMSPEDAAHRLRVWWETEKLQTIRLTSKTAKIPKLERTPGQLGITLDDAATIAKLPTEDFVGDVKASVTHEAFDQHQIDPVFKTNAQNLGTLAELVRKTAGRAAPARVAFDNGSITRVPEVTSYELDGQALSTGVADLLAHQKGELALEYEVPLKIAPKHVPDETLEAITDVVSEFSTRFPTYQVSRCSNIRLAASRLDGHVLLPGERISFNETVGRRTLKTGFKLAGVYKQGKHDTGIGGGICQVSTTMYNAALLGNLKIRQRSNHSMPVAYVPLGRDATVDYGSLDLVIENDFKTPIAITSAYQPGRLTFRILGKKDPGLSVKIIQRNGRSWDRGIQTVVDPKLAPGRRHVIEKGGRGHSIYTFRYVYENGVLINKQALGRSFYGGGPSIVAIGAKPKTATPKGQNSLVAIPAHLPR